MQKSWAIKWPKFQFYFLENHCKTYTTTGSVDSTTLSRNLSQEECSLQLNASKLSERVESIKFIDSQRPGLHISTILRQIMFDVLYGVEFVVLLTFGFSSDVKVISKNFRINFHKLQNCFTFPILFPMNNFNLYFRT